MSKITLCLLELTSDRWTEPVKGETFHGIPMKHNCYLAIHKGTHFYVPANDVKVLCQLYPPPRTPMQLVEDEMEKISDQK